MSKEKILEQAEKFAKEGKYEKAVKELEKILKENPFDMRTKLRIGDMYTRKKEIPTAIKVYKEVADYYTQENFHLKAIAVYKTILKLNPSFIQANQCLAELYKKLGLIKDAANQYYILADYFENNALFDEAMTVQKNIVALDPDNITGRIRLAELYQSHGNPDEAVSQYNTVADLFKKDGNDGGLISVYEKILYYQPDNLAILLPLLRHYTEQKNAKKTVEKIEGSPSSVRERKEVLFLWGDALFETHQHEMARQKYLEYTEALIQENDLHSLSFFKTHIEKKFVDDPEYLREFKNMLESHSISLPETWNTETPIESLDKTEMVDLRTLFGNESSAESVPDEDSTDPSVSEKKRLSDNASLDQTVMIRPGDLENFMKKK